MSSNSPLSSQYFPPTPVQIEIISQLLKIDKELVPVLVPTREQAKPFIRIHDLKVKFETLKKEASRKKITKERVRQLLSPTIRRGSQRWKRALRYLGLKEE
jgi:hypothetical protein